MSNQKISVRQGSTETLSIKTEDDLAVSVRLTVKVDPNDVDPVIDPEPSANFVNGEAILDIAGEDTLGIPPGDYKYQLVVSYADGTEFIFPAPDDECDCDDDCKLPVFQVCESLAEGAAT